VAGAAGDADTPAAHCEAHPPTEDGVDPLGATFFDRHDARLVTTVMCCWDTNWMRAIDPAVSGPRAGGTSLFSLGDDQCRFAVLETDDPLAGYTDKVEQRFVAKQDSG
jgi:hypothetical protein